MRLLRREYAALAEIKKMVQISTSRRGGKCSGAGRKKQADGGSDMRIRILEAEHFHWIEVKTLKKLPNDNTVAKYLLDLDTDFDEQAESSAR